MKYNKTTLKVFRNERIFIKYISFNSYFKTTVVSSENFKRKPQKKNKTRYNGLLITFSDFF